MGQQRSTLNLTKDLLLLQLLAHLWQAEAPSGGSALSVIEWGRPCKDLANVATWWRQTYKIKLANTADTLYIHRYICIYNVCLCIYRTWAHFCAILVKRSQSRHRLWPNPVPIPRHTVRWSGRNLALPGNPNESLDKPTSLNVGGFVRHAPMRLRLGV